jgi:DNA recombination protein RmuC
MIYSKAVMTWVGFILGLLAGAGIAALWLRARIARLEAAREFAENSASKLGETFQSLADAALRSNQTAFLDAARAQLSGDLAQRQTAIEGAVRPLTDSLARLDTHVRQLELAREQAFGSLGNELQRLARETTTLSTALRAPQIRGRWGELTLRRVAELSGMARNCDFIEQETLENNGSRLRPDMIVRLPGDRSIVVDAKVPLTAWLDAANATDENVRAAAFARHGQQVVEHSRLLGNKQYWTQLQPAPELVVLFLPGDHFLHAALEHVPDLLEQALARKVLIATPVTLISVLKGIAYGWTQEQLAQNAEEIRNVASEFCARLQTVYEHYSDTGRQLEKTVESYNRSVGSWDLRLTPALRKMRELGVGGEDEPVLPDRIDVVARQPRAVG